MTGALPEKIDPAPTSPRELQPDQGAETAKQYNQEEARALATRSETDHGLERQLQNELLQPLQPTDEMLADADPGYIISGCRAKTLRVHQDYAV